jgi:hypothetical protein
MNATVDILSTIPEALQKSVKTYFDNHPDWNEDRLLAASLSLFLLQNGDGGDRHVSRVYLDTLFKQ